MEGRKKGKERKGPQSSELTLIYLITNPQLVMGKYKEAEKEALETLKVAQADAAAVEKPSLGHLFTI